MTDTLPLIQTKLYRPPLQADLVLRPRLLDALNAHWKIRPVTLISAPAGYGKSVLASMWLESCDSPSGWVSLDEWDNDLRTFTNYLLAAVKRAFPDIHFQSQALLEAPTLLRPSVLARYLVNDLDQIDKPFILALDDIHVIHEQAILDLLTELLKHPPRVMHLLLIGRHDPAIPVASHRAYRLVTEIRLTDLRFTPPETAELLKQIWHRDIDEDLAAKLTENTEGWATALNLAALSLLHRRETANLRTIIQGDSSYLQEYLLAEVLTHIPLDKHIWLLKTSVLDRFCAPLCAAICQEEGKSLNGQAFVSWLQTSSLFLVPLDDQGEWFRFHHLFQAHLQNLLKRQLDQVEVAALHQQASRWFAQNGWTDEAIQHALAAGDTAAAVDLVAQHRHQLMNEDHWNRLRRWIGLFPDEVVANDPVLSMTKAHIGLTLGRDAETLAALYRAKRLMASIPTDSPLKTEIRGEIAVIKAFEEAVLKGQAADTIANSFEALNLLPQKALHLRCQTIGTQAMGYQMSGDFEQAIRSIGEVLKNTDLPPVAKAKLHMFRSIVYMMQGDLDGVQLSAVEGLQWAMNYNLWATVSHNRYFSGIAHFLRNELVAAESHLLALSESPTLSTPTYFAHGVCALARIFQAQGRFEEARELLLLAHSYLEEVGNIPARKYVRAFQVEIALDQGDLILARRLSSTVDFDVRSPYWMYYVPQMTPIRLLLAEGTPKGLEQALAKLEKLDEYVLRINRKTVRIDVLALQALVHDAQGDWQMASERLSAALHLAEPGGFIRSFLNLGAPMAGLLARLHEQGDTGMDLYISRILAAFQMEERDPIAPALEKPLTERELETLRLLATDLSQKEIASRMTISSATMRTHARNIYQKLEVHGRFEAVHRAKELGLL